MVHIIPLCLAINDDSLRRFAESLKSKNIFDGINIVWSLKYLGFILGPLSLPPLHPPYIFVIFVTFVITRSYAALWAADLDWIVGPGYSLGRVHSGEKP